MSHVVTSEIKIKDLEALRKAVESFGCVMVRKPKYNWFGRSVGDYPLPKGMTEAQLGKCEWAIQVPGAYYEVGVVRLPDGSYTLAFDFYGSSTRDYVPGASMQHDGQKLKTKFGDKLCLLAQQYSKQVTLAAAKKAGYSVMQKVTPEGKIKLQLIQL
jgi:hypothetical protein